MKSAAFLKQIRDQGIEVRLSGDNLELSFAQEQVDPVWIEQIKDRKASLISYLKSITADSDTTLIPLTPPADRYPITAAQLRFWILCQMEAINPAYNLPLILELNGQIEEAHWQQAFLHLVERHEILRTHLLETAEGGIAQQVLSADDFNFELSMIQLENRTEARQWITDFTAVSFKLKQAPLFKAALVRCDENHAFLCIVMHHIISDGWSLEIVLRDLSLLYNRLQGDAAGDLPQMQRQFKDYAVWTHRLQDKSKERAYWLQKFKNAAPSINLPTYQARPSLKTYDGAVYTHAIDPAVLQLLRQFATQNKGTVFTGLMAALNGLLHRYTGQNDIILGTPFSGRSHPELHQQIGLYINTLPIRMQFPEASTFSELWQLQKQTMEEAFIHADYSFGDLVNELNLSRDTSRSPLFDLLVIHHQQDQQPGALESTFTGLECSIYEELEHTVSKYDVTFTFVEKEDALSLVLEYNTNLFQRAFIEDLAKNFEFFARAVLTEPTLPINEVAYVHPAQRAVILSDFNATQTDFDPSKTALDLFRQKAEELPDEVALICEDRALSYAGLDQKSTQLARYLASLDLEPDSCIGLCMGRSMEMVIAIFGIMKAGFSYLPLDPFYPLERLDYIIEHSRTPLVVADQQTKALLPPSIRVATLKDAFASDHVAVPRLPSVKGESRAYVIYTSGTTGKPKGVAVSHRNLTNFLIGMDQRLGGEKQQAVWLAMTSISFDISILELIWTLTRGDRVVIHLERPAPIQAKPAMAFSLFYFPTGASPKVNKYQLLLEGSVFADQNGFEAIWVPERHFHEFGDQFPNPSVAAAAVSTITSSIKLRSGSVVLPLHDPVRVAEEWSMVDNLSNGRVEISVASGWHPNDFVLAPADYKDRRQKMRAGISELKQLWEGRTITRKNGVGQDFEFKVHPTPVQAELPIWITAAGSVETFEYAGSIGANILTHLLGQSIEDLDEKIKAYRRSLKEHGFRPESGKVALMLHTFVGTDEANVRQTVEGPFKNYLKNSLNLIRPIAEEQGLDLEQELDVILDIGFQRFYKTSALFGTVDSCMQIVERAFKVQVTEIACLIDFGVAEREVMKSLPHLQKLKEGIRRSKAQEIFVRERMEKLTAEEMTSELILRHSVTHLQSTPSFYQDYLLDHEAAKTLPQIQTLLVGGEALKDKLAQKLVSSTDAAIFNMYGPTETTIWSCVQQIKAGETVNIGRPIANTGVYILDRYGALCPVGVPGELCIGGEGVSLGYLHDREKTDGKFVNSPFKPGEKIYKTGDLAAWLPNGVLNFLGRLDRQVKINGYRIELEEIENVLLQNPEVTQCVVTTYQAAEKIQLVAYLQYGRSDVNEKQLKTFLSSRLPHYMIPAYLLQVTEFPLTPNGKIDVKQLPKPEKAKQSTKPRYRTPATDTEKKLAAIWEAFLQMEKISIDDNFFEIGGNSMKAFQLLTRINSEMDTDLKIISFFQYPTIQLLAENLYEQALPEPEEQLEMEMEDIDDLIEFMDSI